MEVNWNELTIEAVRELLKIFIPVLVMLILKWGVEIWKKLKEKNPDIAKLIAYAAKLGYAAAEDYFRKKTATGEAKMAYAISRAAEYLSNVDVTVDQDVLKDAITDYGVSEYKFSWVKPNIDLILPNLGKVEEEPEDEDTEEEDEPDHEPGAADYMRVRNPWYDHNADSDQSGKQSAGSDQGTAEDKKPE